MIGSMIVADDALRLRLARVAHGAAGMSFNRIGMLMCTAAWEHGDEWLDALLDYLAENRRIFDEAMALIPGVRSMPIEATYLCWVDFADTGMDRAEFTRRVEQLAEIAVNHGNSFGVGGDSFLRFNIACRRDLIVEAVERLKNAFSDLQ
jgi:cystathionine beta-lyase